MQHTTPCDHISTLRLSVRGFSGPVTIDEVRAAHGNVTVLVECAACGSRRHENHNGNHEEIGPWGPTHAKRKAALDEAHMALRRARDARPSPLAMRCNDKTYVVHIDHMGYLVVPYGGPDGAAIYRARPDYVDAALRVRQAFGRTVELETAL